MKSQNFFVTDIQRKDNIFVAIQKKDYDKVKIFCEDYINLTQKNKSGNTPIVYAALRKNWFCVELISKTTKTNFYDFAHYGEALLEAVKENRTDIVNCLFKAGAQANWLDEKDNSCLHLAMRNGNFEMVKTLLENPRSDLSEKNKKNETPISVALLHGKWDCIEKTAKNYPNDLFDSAEYGIALLDAVLSNWFRIVLTLLIAGAKPNWTYRATNNNCAHLAIKNKNPLMLALLISYLGENILSEKNEQGKKPTELADGEKIIIAAKEIISKKNLTVLKMLILKKNISVRKRHYKTPQKLDELFAKADKILIAEKILPVIMLQAKRNPGNFFYQMPWEIIISILEFFSSIKFSNERLTQKNNEKLITISAECFVSASTQSFFSMPSASKRLVNDIQDALEKEENNHEKTVSIKTGIENFLKTLSTQETINKKNAVALESLKKYKLVNEEKSETLLKKIQR